MTISKTISNETTVSNFLTIGIVGFGNFGQFLGKFFAAQGHRFVEYPTLHTGPRLFATRLSFPSTLF